MLKSKTSRWLAGPYLHLDGRFHRRCRCCIVV